MASNSLVIVSLSRDATVSMSVASDMRATREGCRKHPGIASRKQQVTRKDRVGIISG